MVRRRSQAPLRRFFLLRKQAIISIICTAYDSHFPVPSLIARPFWGGTPAPWDRDGDKVLP